MYKIKKASLNSIGVGCPVIVLHLYSSVPALAIFCLLVCVFLFNLLSLMQGTNQFGELAVFSSESVWCEHHRPGSSHIEGDNSLALR